MDKRIRIARLEPAPKMRVGANPQAHAVLRLMIEHGLVVSGDGETYRITSKGKRVSGLNCNSLSAWADAEMGIDQSYKD
jgi:hypothetical protein